MSRLGVVRVSRCVRSTLFPTKKITRFLFSGNLQTLFWAKPPQRWQWNVSICGVNVYDQSVAWFSVCQRGRLTLWARLAVIEWLFVLFMVCVFIAKLVSGLGLYEITLGADCWMPSKSMWAWKDKIIQNPKWHGSPKFKLKWSVAKFSNQGRSAADKNIPLVLNQVVVANALSGMAKAVQKSDHHWNQKTFSLKWIRNIKIQDLLTKSWNHHTFWSTSYHTYT